MYIYGIHPVVGALKKRPKALHRLLVSRSSGGDDFKRIISAATASRIPVTTLPVKELSQLCKTEQHQGIAAEIEPFPLMFLEHALALWKKQGDKALFLVLDAIQDPQNFGSLIRTAYCCGANGVIFPQDRSASLTGAVAKASSGAIEHIPLCQVVNIASTLDMLKTEGIWIVGTAPRASSTLYEFDFNLHLALVIGGEAKGMRQLVAKKCDFSVSIPMKGEMDSLNAAVAGAVVLFEIMRQRQYKTGISNR
jgi:23S rRNA (guanosine2251-2'-O)-methyltransferase